MAVVWDVRVEDVSTDISDLCLASANTYVILNSVKNNMRF